MLRASRPRLGRALAAGALLFGATPIAACGAGNAATGGRGDPNVAGGGSSWSSCPVGPADAPFLVDGDTGTREYFKAQTRNDVVFVHYDGHTLNVLDGCRDDLAPGSLGAYEQLDEKAGPIQTLDVADATTMCAKLPLASAAFGARVRGGEALRLSYYVSGTRTATRAAIDERSLAPFPGCRGATHFVYAYDLGAFALASSRALTTNEQNAGELARCAPSEELGRTPQSCMVPIRVALRPVTPAPPGAPPPTPHPGPATAADDLATTIYTAQQKLRFRDGPACLVALDTYDKIAARPGRLSTDTTAGYTAMMRGQCLMLAGQCEPGRRHFRATWANDHPQDDADRTDIVTDVMVGQYCQGPNLSSRERFLKARMDLQRGAWTARLPPNECTVAYRELMSLRTTVLPRNDEDALVKDPLLFMLSAAPSCFARAGDCAAAYAAYREVAVAHYGSKQPSFASDEATLRRHFASATPKCK